MPKVGLNIRANAVKWFSNSYYLSLAGIIVYNNWVLALVLNPQATIAGATTSELGAHGQPWALLFRAFDVIAGILLLVGMGQITSLGNNRGQRDILRFAMSIFGLTTITESFLPLDCSSAVNQLCAQTERLGLVSWHHNLHLHESPIAYGFMFLLPLTVVLAARLRVQAHRLVLASWFLMMFMSVWGIETAIRFKLHAVNYGYEQRLFIIIFTIWFIVALRTQIKQKSLH